MRGRSRRGEARPSVRRKHSSRSRGFLCRFARKGNPACEGAAQSRRVSSHAPLTWRDSEPTGNACPKYPEPCPRASSKTAEFARFAAKARIADALLVAAIERVERGLVDADLGGGILKLRIARPSGGRSGGYRTIVACIIEERAFFLFGYAKNEMENVTPKALRRLRAAADALLGIEEQDLMNALQRGDLMEIER